MSMTSSTSTTKSTGSSTVPAHPYAAYSVAEWKRQPSTFEIIYGLELPYRAPKSAFGTLIWKWRLWIEVTFALSMLQPWEKVLVGTYNPSHLNFNSNLISFSLRDIYSHHLKCCFLAVPCRIDPLFPTSFGIPSGQNGVLPLGSRCCRHEHVRFPQTAIHWLVVEQYAALTCVHHYPRAIES